MRDILEQYKETRRHCRKMAGKVAGAEDRTQWNAMGNHAEYVIRWLEKGREPGAMRGVERRAAYQREIPVDPHLFPFDKYMDCWVDGGGVVEKDFSMIIAARDLLTEKQWEAFEMYYAGMYSYGEIGDALGISKESAYYRVKGAKAKLEKYLTNAT